MMETKIDASLRKLLTGAARFVDDQVPRRGMLETWPVTSPHASALITRRDASKAREVKGVRAILLAEDIPGLNHVGAIRDDEPLLAHANVSFYGQIVALVVGESREVCERAAALVEVEYQPLPAVLTIEQAIAVSSYHTDEQVIETGNCERALVEAPRRIEGRVSSGGQDHFSLETQAAWAEPIEGTDICVQVSSQHPSQIQALVADVLGKGKSEVRVECRRVGGGFGSRETQAHTWAALAALAAYATGSAVRVCLTRAQDMALTGKRQAVYAEYKVGFENGGRLRAVSVSLFANGGWSLDLSGSITERALLHLDNAYHVPEVRFAGRVCKTNLASNTSCLGSGVAEAVLVMEEILDRVAFETGVAGEEVRSLNLYGRGGNPARTPGGQPVAARALASIWQAVLETSAYGQRCEAVERWNREHQTTKRGLGVVPAKVGVGFPVRSLNQAGALVNVLTDGSVQVNHGAADSGDGIHAKMRREAARVLGIREDRIRVMDPSTEKVPNTSATAASCGSELNGRAVRDACEVIVERMRPVAAQLLLESGQPIPELSDLLFADGFVTWPGNPARKVDISEVIFFCWRNRISLSATGFYRTPGNSFGRGAGKDGPFQYFSLGAAVTEVEIDGLTGQSRVIRADILQDAGASPHLAIDRSQLESGFMMGMGWLTSEELLWDRDGVLWTDSPSRYKIPTIGDLPRRMHVNLRMHEGEEKGGGGEIRDVGEAGVALATSVRSAMKAAVGAFGRKDLPVELDAPATPESVYRAIAVRGGWEPPRERVARREIPKEEKAAGADRPEAAVAEKASSAAEKAEALPLRKAKGDTTSVSLPAQRPGTKGEAGDGNSKAKDGAKDEANARARK